MNFQSPVQLRNALRDREADAGCAQRVAGCRRFTHHVSRFTRFAAFTLIELLTVIAIIGLLAAITTTTILHFRKGDSMLSATRMMLDGVAYARQLAISQHTTVFMVFVPTNFWANTPLYQNANARAALNPYPSELAKLTNALEKQLTGFTFISIRSIGDQPGQYTRRYLSEWHSLPEKAFIADWKFALTLTQTNPVGYNPNTGQPFPVTGFQITNVFPFPSEDTPYVIPPNSPWFSLPYVAFDYQGRLVMADGTPLGRDEYIPLAHGSVAIATDAKKNPIQSAPSVLEQPPGNSLDTSYNLIHIDWLTGRARLEHQQVQ